MNSSLQRRINIATCWASSRVALLDSIESYEDSYAITQEFREWIVCLESKEGNINSSLMKVPTFLNKESNESDEVVEL